MNVNTWKNGSNDDNYYVSEGGDPEADSFIRR